MEQKLRLGREGCTENPEGEVSVQPINPTGVPGYDPRGLRPKTARFSAPVGKHVSSDRDALLLAIGKFK